MTTYDLDDIFDIASAPTDRLKEVLDAPAGAVAETMRELARLELDRRNGAWA